MTSIYAMNRGCDLSKPSSDDDPLLDLQLLEQNLKDGFSRVLLQNAALARSLGRDGVDVDLESILENVKDVVDDELGLQLMALENK